MTLTPRPQLMYERHATMTFEIFLNTQVSFLHLAEDEREVGIPESMQYDAPVRCAAVQSLAGCQALSAAVLQCAAKLHCCITVMT